MTQPLQDAIRESYEDITYHAGPHYTTHPSRLATVATLLGVDAPDPRRCRVLEIGCATGGNIIPIAAQAPESTFVGFDLSPSQVKIGLDLIEAAQLTNVHLEALDILEVDDPVERWGTFDYILCHGVFSWVPSPVQDRILTICRKGLGPNGVAYISYNTYPGSQRRDLARGVARFGAGHVLQDARDVSQVLAFWDAVADAMPEDDHVVKIQLRRALEEVKDAKEYYVAHEYLEDVNQPLWFYEFVDKAHAADLQYLGDSMRLADPTDFPEATQQAMSRLAPSLVARQQFLDLASNSSFRRTLLCQRELEVPRAPQVGVIEQMHAVATTHRVEEDKEGRVTFRTRGGREFTTNIPLLVQSLDLLHEAWPEALPVRGLFERAKGTKAVAAAPAAPSDFNFFQSALLQLWLQNGVELTCTPFALTTSVGERPLVHAFTRVQASRGLPLTNLLHQEVVLPPEDQEVVPLVDGTRDLAELLRDWQALQPERASKEPEWLMAFLSQLANAALLYASPDPPTET